MTYMLLLNCALKLVEEIILSVKLITLLARPFCSSWNNYIQLHLFLNSTLDAEVSD